MKEIEERIRSLEQKDAIRHLKHFTYCLCIDKIISGDKEPQEQVSAHLTDDVIADFSGFPVMRGRS